MAADDRSTRLRIDSDGVKIQHSGVRTGVWLLVLAMGLIGVAVFLAARPTIKGNLDDTPSRPDRNLEARRIAAEPATRSAVRRLETTQMARTDASAPEHPAQADDQEQAAIAPRDAVPAHAAAPADDNAGAPSSEATGMALFPPPGTKPIKRGIIVPEDFDLPPGYVRHYQATDDGQRVPAILMFHPDYKPVDEHGAPIPLPEDRVVPADMAPPGLPIQMLEPPETEATTADAPENENAAGAEP